MDHAQKLKIAQQFTQALPHCRALGMQVIDIGEGVVTMTMPYSEHIIGDPETGVIHGGAVSALMDSCGGAAVHSLGTEVKSTATLDLRIDYMRAATPGQAVTARAECYHVARSVVFIRAVAHDEDASRPVATATGAFTVERT